MLHSLVQKVADSHPEGWTLIGCQGVPDATLLWVDLRQERRFDRELSNRHLLAWLEEKSPPIVRTGLAALMEVEENAALHPSLIIVHASRCGSTLLARLAAAASDASLLLEPQLLLQLLSHDLAGELGYPPEIVLPKAVRALTPQSDRPGVLKLNSRTTRFLPALRKAFPKTPVIWLQRQPVEIVESNLSRPPSSGLLGLSGEEMAQWVLRWVTLGFMAAKAHVDRHVHVLDYEDFPDLAEARLAEIMGFDLTRQLPRMQEVMRHDSKTGKPYVPRRRQALPDEMRKLIHDTLDPLYHALASRRRA